MADAFGVEWEYGLEVPPEAAGGMPGLMYVTRNALLAETLHAARPSVPMLRRPATPWQAPTTREESPHD